MSKAEDKYEATKQKVKETAIEAVGGQKNVEFIEQGCNLFALISETFLQNLIIEVITIII